jgi:CTP:molybdopterin cytidylyltransferase MocA
MSAYKEHPFAAVVLAAGAGTRFGMPKAGARLPDGRRFLDVVVERCQTCGADPVVAIIPPDTEAPAGVRAVVNARAADEQVVSLRLGLDALSDLNVHGVLVWPVDHPLARDTSGLAVVDAARRTGAPVVVPVHEGARGHPVWFAREVWPQLLSVTEGGARAVVHALGARVHEVPVDDDGVLRDIDTKDDLGT